MPIKRPHLAILLFLTAGLLGGCATNPVTGDPNLVMMSEDQELQIGREMHQQVLKQMGEYDDPELQRYVQVIGGKLAENSHRDDLVYRFTVVDSPDVNAFALPGGYIYITRGLLAYLNCEDELAAVLGHEIGHVTARHSVRQHATGTLAGLLGAIVTAQTGSRAVGDLSNVLGTAFVRGYGREHELESDRLGAEYLARSGYDPQAMIRVIEVLKNQELLEQTLAEKEGREPRSYHGLFATHPANDVRLQEVVAAAESLAGERSGCARREEFLQQLDGLVWGDSAEQGVRRGSAFYHGPMNFGLRYPDGWRIHNEPARLVATAPDNKAALLLSAEDVNRKIPPREFMQRRLGLRGLSQGEELQLEGGLQGYTALGQLPTKRGRVPARVAVIYHQQRAFVLVGLSDDELAEVDPALLQAIRSFHPLNEEERQLAEPKRLQIITADAGTTLQTLARRSTIPNDPIEQLRLLNGLYPGGEPTAGQKLKVVR